MNEDLSSRFERFVSRGELLKCISTFEANLQAMPRTPFHSVIGANFSPLADSFAAYLENSCQSAEKSKVKLAAMYVEMNGFAHNTDLWFCDPFGYKTEQNLEDLDWLAYWDFELRPSFVLSGMESVQEAFATGDWDKPAIRRARELAEYLVNVRFMQLVDASHRISRDRSKLLSKIPVLATAHDWDAIYRSK